MQAFETPRYQNQGGLFEVPLWIYRETVLQKRNASGHEQRETGPMVEEKLLKNPFDSSWLQQKLMDLTSAGHHLLAHHVTSQSFILQDHQIHLHFYKLYTWYKNTPHSHE